jgi:hypothetical protein
MADWSTLPVEIHSIILELVAEDYHFNSELYACAGYASVCREWQPVFEQRNFSSLFFRATIYNFSEVYWEGKE